MEGASHWQSFAVPWADDLACAGYPLHPFPYLASNGVDGSPTRIVLPPLQHRELYHLAHLRLPWRWHHLRRYPSRDVLRRLDPVGAAVIALPIIEHVGEVHIRLRKSFGIRTKTKRNLLSSTICVVFVLPVYSPVNNKLSRNDKQRVSDLDNVVPGRGEHPTLTETLSIDPWPSRACSCWSIGASVISRLQGYPRLSTWNPENG
jgi:hypothetical protein